jgi:hypothetical protein
MDELKDTFLDLRKQTPQFDFYAKLKQYNPQLAEQ